MLKKWQLIWIWTVWKQEDKYPEDQIHTTPQLKASTSLRTTPFCFRRRWGDKLFGNDIPVSPQPHPYSKTEFALTVLWKACHHFSVASLWHCSVGTDICWYFIKAGLPVESQIGKGLASHCWKGWEMYYLNTFYFTATLKIRSGVASERLEAYYCISPLHVVLIYIFYLFVLFYFVLYVLIFSALGNGLIYYNSVP